MVSYKPKKVDLDLLSRTIDLMNKAKDFQVIAEIIFNFIQNFVNFNMAVIYRLNEKEKILEMVSCIGANVERMKRRMPFKVGESAVGLVAKDKKALLINDVLKSKEITVRQYYDEDPIIRSFLAVPLVVGDKIIGILSVSSSKPYEYDEYDVKMINIVTSQGAVLLELNNDIMEAENFSNQILENVNSGVVAVNGKYEIIIFNKASEKITGYTYNEVLGKDIRTIPLKKNGEDWSIINSMVNGKILFEEPGYMIRKDGHHVRIRLSTSLIYDENNSLKSCICIFRDNTEIEKLQKQIAMADKLAALGRLTSGITHEIRNPLLPIRNASEYLLGIYNRDRHRENSEEIIKLLSIISEESERLNRFLGQLVNLNKDTFFVTGECDLVKILQETLTLIGYGIRKSDIKLALDIRREKVKVPFNEDNMKQIFLNLMLNAIDAINLNKENGDGCIRILIDVEDNYATIEIKDNGIGIPKGEIHKIFDPFYTTKSNGTGIGLPIIHNIISNSTGKILVKSEENCGTTMTLLLPIV